MNEYHRFVRLLYEACHASEAVDRFDLHSESSTSVAAFRGLEDAQSAAFMALATHVRDHAEAIISHIDGEANPPPSVAR